MRAHNPAHGRAGRHRAVLLGLAALSLVSALAFVLAPVQRPDAVYSWPAAPGDPSAVAIPLSLGTPAELTATIGCAAVRAADEGTVLLATVPLDGVVTGNQLTGLRVSATAGGLHVRTGGRDLPDQPVPATGDCTWTLHSTATATTLRLDGRVVAERAGDLRPGVAGVFTQSPTADGLSVDVTADTIFQTSPSLLKTACAVLAVLSLVAALLLVFRDERDRPEPAGEGPRPAGRPHLRGLVDAAVVGALLVWNVIGGLTVDDGYIAGIIRSRAANGYVGNVFRWFNAPEAPFGWFYEVMVGWAQVSEATVWMRLPSTLLGIATWFLLGRGLLPRLGRFTAGTGWYAAAAATFTLWWLPGNLGLRPEAWVAAGVVTVLVLLERGLARGRMLPVLVGLVVAGATLAVTPTGAIAFLPYLAAAVPVLRLARRREGPGLPVLTLVGAAAAASALLLMFADQSLAAVLRATEIRSVLPGALPWSAEAERWYLLLKAGELQGSLVRRVPVLLTVVAVLGILWQRLSGRWPETAARDVADRLVVTFGLSLVVLLFTPTKWTLHFGAFAPVGTALVVLGMHLFDRRATWAAARPGRSPLRSRVPTGRLAVAAAALAVVLFVAAWSYAGWNQYAYLSNSDVPWNNLPPVLLGRPLSGLFLAAAGLVAVLGTGLVVAARVRDAADAAVPLVRWLPSPALAAVVLVGATVLLQFGSLGKAAAERRDTYSLAGDAVATAEGRPCGLAEDLAVERDPRAGLLALSPATSPAGADPGTDGFTEVTDGDTGEGPRLAMAGQALPGWSATGHTTADGTAPARLTTGWYALPAGFAGGDRPLVITTTGDRGSGTRLVAEFGRVSGGTVSLLGTVPLPVTDQEPATTDTRLPPSAAPAGADVVRLSATDGAAPTQLPLSVSAPRVPVTTPFREVVDEHTPALVDWPVAFVFPCQELSVQSDGRTDVPRWRIASANGAGDIITDLAVGGPYTAARTLVDQVPVPVYELGRPTERPVLLFEWRPHPGIEQPVTDVGRDTVTAWAQ